VPGWPIDVTDAVRTVRQSSILVTMNQRGALTVLGGVCTCHLAVISVIVAITTAG